MRSLTERRLLRKVRRLETEIARKRQEIARLEEAFHEYGAQYERLTMTRRALIRDTDSYLGACAECLSLGI
jgi:uncharacterized protein (DUF3084 family)